MRTRDLEWITFFTTREFRVCLPRNLVAPIFIAAYWCSILLFCCFKGFVPFVTCPAFISRCCRYDNTPFNTKAQAIWSARGNQAGYRCCWHVELSISTVWRSFRLQTLNAGTFSDRVSELRDSGSALYTKRFSHYKWLLIFIDHSLRKKLFRTLNRVSREVLISLCITWDA